MAFDDALFQLGMDLTRSSTAQKEDSTEVTAVTHEDHGYVLIQRDESRLLGTHLIVDLNGAKRLDDAKHIERTLKRCVETIGVQVQHIHVSRFPAGGISGVAMFAEGHVNIRTWPERDFAAVDLMFMARNGVLRQQLTRIIEAAFEPSGLETTVCKRSGGEVRKKKTVAQPVVRKVEGARKLARAA